MLTGFRFSADDQIEITCEMSMTANGPTSKLIAAYSSKPTLYFRGGDSDDRSRPASEARLWQQVRENMRDVVNSITPSPRQGQES